MQDLTPIFKDVVAEIASDALSANYLRSLSIDEPFVRQAGNREYYHLDALGSSVVLSDVNGASVVTYSYEAFGKTVVSGASSNPYQFTNRENDGTGLYNYRFRYYAPSTHRFVSEDRVKLPIPAIPIELQTVALCNKNTESVGKYLLAAMYQQPQRTHSYLYAMDAPLNVKDPLGLAPATSADCGFYLNECPKSGSTNSYACSAFIPCYISPDNDTFNCIRGCVMDKYKNGCTTWSCQFSGGKTGAGAHGECFDGCIRKNLK